MKTVNKAFLEDILSPLTGGADMDDMEYFEELNPNDEYLMKDVIKTVFLPFFNEQTQPYKEALKNTFMYYLTTRSIDFGRIIYSCLLPFKSFDKPILFYEWMWAIFWPNESFIVSNPKDYIEKNDIYEPVRYSLKS